MAPYGLRKKRTTRSNTATTWSWQISRRRSPPAAVSSPSDAPASSLSSPPLLSLQLWLDLYVYIYINIIALCLYVCTSRPCETRRADPSHGGARRRWWWWGKDEERDEWLCGGFEFCSLSLWVKRRRQGSHHLVEWRHSPHHHSLTTTVLLYFRPSAT